MASVIGAFDRTGEFRACAKSFHQRIISGRAQLNPHGTSRLKKYSTPRSSEFLAAAQSLAGDLQLSLTKLRKLSLLLGEPSESTDTKSVSKLIEVIQCDIVDLNKALSALHITQSSTRSIATGGSSQLNKHQQLMITALEYRMSFLVSEFRRLLQENKTHLTGLSQGTITRPVSAESERNVASQSPTATSNFTNSTNPVYAPHIPHDEQIRHEHPVQLTSPIGSTDIWPTQPLQPPGHIHPPKPTGQGAQPVSFFIANPVSFTNCFVTCGKLTILIDYDIVSWFLTTSFILFFNLIIPIAFCRHGLGSL